jgi:hypothetical protein
MSDELFRDRVCERDLDNFLVEGASLLAWLERRGGTVTDYVFPSRVDHEKHMSTR